MVWLTAKRNATRPSEALLRMQQALPQIEEEEVQATAHTAADTGSAAAKQTSALRAATTRAEA
jgi:hypothetical protein